MNKVVRPRNKLKEKTGEGGFSNDVLEKAQKALDDNTVEEVTNLAGVKMPAGVIPKSAKKKPKNYLNSFWV